MANVHDVAAFIVRHSGNISAMKLQKLTYYSQAWHLVWEEQPLFDATIEAWANGPVVHELYQQHRGRYMLHEWPWGNVDGLTPSEQESVEAVLAAYGKFSAQELSELTHREQPWTNARQGLGPTERSNHSISLEGMQEYYSAVAATGEAHNV